ncbi:MAG: hypothetical protein ACI8ZV_001925 [Chitinophagales bacterium]
MDTAHGSARLSKPSVTVLSAAVPNEKIGFTIHQSVVRHSKANNGKFSIAGF